MLKQVTFVRATQAVVGFVSCTVSLGQDTAANLTTCSRS